MCGLGDFVILQELGFSYVELNASDTRSKRSLQDEIAVALGSRTLVDYLGKSCCVYAYLIKFVILLSYVVGEFSVSFKTSI